MLSWKACQTQSELAGGKEVFAGAVRMLEWSAEKASSKLGAKMTTGTSVIRSLAIVALLAAAGCAGKTDVRGSVDPPQLADCEKSPLSTIDYETRAELDLLLVGRWQRCGAPQARGEDVGVEFAEDGRWYALTRDPRGQVVRRPGIDYGGTWAYFPRGSIDPISHQPSARSFFELDGVITDAPSFANEPRQMRILFSPVQSRYVPVGRR